VNGQEPSDKNFAGQTCKWNGQLPICLPPGCATGHLGLKFSDPDAGSINKRFSDSESDGDHSLKTQWNFVIQIWYFLQRCKTLFIDYLYFNTSTFYPPSVTTMVIF
jgi:hypothetical protein